MLTSKICGKLVPAMVIPLECECAAKRLRREEVTNDLLRIVQSVTVTQFVRLVGEHQRYLV